MGKTINPSTGRLIEDYTGQKFGWLTALRPLGGTRAYGVLWEFECECGNVTTASIKNVKSGKQKSCGCKFGKYIYSKKRGSWVKDLTGMTFGRWTVLELDENSDEVMWICRCECGTIRSVRRKALTTGNSLSCGCRTKEAVIEAASRRVYKLNTDIPAKEDRLYRVWGNMKARCFNKNAPDYPRYGGRGITVCSEWVDDFPAFKKWAIASGYDYDAPRFECTLDRIDNDGPYAPDNCRWVSAKVQIANQRRPEVPTLPDNRRKVLLVSEDGAVIKAFESIREASKETGCNPSCIGRVCRGEQQTSRGLHWRYAE